MFTIQQKDGRGPDFLGNWSVELLIMHCIIEVGINSSMTYWTILEFWSLVKLQKNQVYGLAQIGAISINPQQH